MPGGGTKAARLPAESEAAPGSAGTAATRESTVSMPSPTRRVAPGPRASRHPSILLYLTFVTHEKNGIGCAQ